MPYKIRKAKCKQSDDTPGSYVLSYTDKRGKKHRACHTSKKKAKGQIAAIEMESLIRRTVSDIIKEELSSTKDDNHMKIKLSQLRKIIRETIEEVKLPRTMKIISLLYSDNQVGTHEYGFIPRKSGEDPDDEDRRYQRHLKSQGLEARVWDGKAQIAAIEMESLIRPDAEEDIDETDLAEDEFTYAIAKAAAKGEKSVDIDGEKFPVKMSKEKAKDIVSKQK